MGRGGGKCHPCHPLATTLLATYSQCSSPQSVTYNNANGVVYAACVNGGVISINGSTVTTLATSSQCPISISVSYNSANGVVYAACENGGVISINGSTITTLATYSQCPISKSVTYNSANGVVYATCENGGVISINGSTITTLATSSQCPTPYSVSYNDANGVVYAACQSGGVISINGSTITTLTTFSQCPSPQSVTYNSANGVVYATCENGGVISINGSTITTIATSSQCPKPNSVACNNANGAVYAACVGGGVISISGSTITSLTTYSQCPSPESVTFSSANATSSQCPNPYSVFYNTANGLLYAACNSDVISINGSTITTLATSSQCPDPQSVTCNNANGVIYAACQMGGIISINGSTITTLSTSSQCPSAYSVSYNSANGVVYAACHSGGVISINGSTITTLATSSQCPSPESVTYNNANGVVYAACQNSVISINGSNITTLATSSQCLNPVSVTYNSAHDVVYAACLQGGVISINGSTITTLATYSQCSSPQSVTYNNANGVVYAACHNGVIAIANYSCPPGFGMGTTEFACEVCNPGFFRSSLATSLYCSPCVASTYTSDAGSISCSNCPFGLWSSDGSAFCNGICPAGRYGNGTASISSSCTGPCEEGYFCPPGSGSPTTQPCGSVAVYCPEGSGVPILASPGNYTAGGNSSTTRTATQVCEPSYYCVGGVRTSCPVGEYGSVGGMSACQSCPLGQASSKPGSTNCSLCGPGTYVASNSSYFCLTCPPDTYTLTDGSIECKKCDQDGLFCSNGTITVSAGYWGFISSADEIMTVPCPVNLCLGGMLSSQCAPGRYPSPGNALCGACLPRWSEWDGKCIDCTAGTNGGLIFLFILVTWGCVLLIHYLSQKKNDTAVLGIFLYFVQTALLIAGPAAFWLSWLALFKFTPQNTSGIPCPANLNPYQHMALAVLVGLMAFILLAVTMILHWLLCYISNHTYVRNGPSIFKCVENADGSGFFRSRLQQYLPPCTLNPYIRTSVSLFLYSYTQTASVVLAYLNCVDAGTGDRVVFSNPAISCNSDKYKRWLPVIIILFIVQVIGTPLMIAVFLYRKRTYFQSGKPEAKMNRFNTRWGILFEPYITDLYWWQAVILIRRIVAVILDTFIVANLQWKMLGLSLLHFAVLLIQLQVKPYVKDRDNHLEIGSIVILIVLSSFLTANPAPYLDWVQVLISVLVSGPVCLFMIVPITAYLCDHCSTYGADNVDPKDDGSINDGRDDFQPATMQIGYVAAPDGR